MSISYDELDNLGFLPQQINQILLLASHYEEADLLTLSNSVDVENIRKLNSILKDDSILTHEKKDLLKVLAVNVDPGFFMAFKDNSAKSNFMQIVRNRYYYEKSGVDFPEMLSYIVRNPKSIDFIYSFVDDCITNKLDPFSILRDGFSEEQADFAFYLKEAELDFLIPEINKTIFRCYDDMKDIKKMIDLKMDYTAIINLYSDIEINDIISAFEEGYDIHSVVKQLTYSPGMVHLCKELMKVEVEDDEIKEILTKYPYKEIKGEAAKWKRLIELEGQGYEVHKYFDKMPNCNQMDILEQLIDIGYEDEDIGYYLTELGEKVEKIDNRLRLSVGDVEKYIQLLDEGYDITNLVKNDWHYEEINILMKLAEIKDLEIQELLDKEFADFEFDLFADCLRYGREDVFEAAVNCENPDREAYENIRKIFENDEKTGQFHDVVNILYDKGNDAFFDFDYCYEFDSYQKFELTELILKRNLTDEQIDVIRSNDIDSEKISILGAMIEKGYDISSVMKKINDLSDDNLRDIYSCMKMGFMLVLPEKNIER